MRILQIYELGPTNQIKVFSGIDVAILELSRHLSELGNDVTILTGAGKSRGDDSGGFIDNVEIIPVDFAGIMNKTWSPWGLKLLRQLTFPIAAIKRRVDDFDIYHGHIYTSGLLANYLARKNQGKAVNTIHGSYYPIWDTIEPHLKASFYKAGERVLAPWLAKLSDLQIHTGGYFARQVIDWGAPEHKIKVIHNGVDPNIFNPKVAPASLDKGSPTIFTARRLVKKNGLEYLVKALHRVLKEENCNLLIAGDGPERRKLKTLVERLNLSRHVTFLGLIPHDQIPPYLSLADIAVIPSIIEASSLFMLEAMATGKPVIATNTGAIPEILNHNNGILVEPMNGGELAEKILDLLEDEDRRGRVGERAYQDVMQKYTWAKIAKQTEREYQRILGG